MVFGDAFVEVTLLVARLCSVSRVAKFLAHISGVSVGAFDLINCSWSVFRFVFAVTALHFARLRNNFRMISQEVP